MPSQTTSNKNWPEFKARLGQKILEPSKLRAAAESFRLEGKTIATLNGSFDLLHAGHLHIIYEASKQADILIVGLNSDASVKAYKGPHKPYVPLQERMELVAALSFVSYVTYFDETDPRNFISTVRPDVHVNGAEYGENCIEKEAVDSAGASLFLVDRIPGLSTSELISKIISVETCASF